MNGPIGDTLVERMGVKSTEYARWNTALRLFQSDGTWNSAWKWGMVVHVAGADGIENWSQCWPIRGTRHSMARTTHSDIKLGSLTFVAMLVCVCCQFVPYEYKSRSNIKVVFGRTRNLVWHRQEVSVPISLIQQ